MATKDISDKQVCEAYYAWHEVYRHNAKTIWPYDILMVMTGQCFKVCYRAMERADKRGYIDCGVSLRTGWLTEKGESLLRS